MVFSKHFLFCLFFFPYRGINKNIQFYSVCSCLRTTKNIFKSLEIVKVEITILISIVTNIPHWNLSYTWQGEIKLL